MISVNYTIIIIWITIGKLSICVISGQLTFVYLRSHHQYVIRIVQMSYGTTNITSYLYSCLLLFVSLFHAITFTPLRYCLLITFSHRLVCKHARRKTRHHHTLPYLWISLLHSTPPPPPPTQVRYSNPRPERSSRSPTMRRRKRNGMKRWRALPRRN